MLINIDPANPNGAPPFSIDLWSAGYTGVRLVSRDDSTVRKFASDCQTDGLMVLAMIGQQSDGFMMPEADVYQIGNEPDSTGPASWTRTPVEYAEDWRIYRETYPGFTMIAAGLASGRVTWWNQLWSQTIGLPGCDGMAIHPYGRSASQAASLINAYTKHGLPVWITEWNRPDHEVAAYAAMLRSAPSVAMSAYFCWSDGMVPGFGITPTAVRQLRGCV